MGRGRGLGREGREKKPNTKIWGGWGEILGVWGRFGGDLGVGG